MRGGKREGAGRKLGSVSEIKKEKLLAQEEIQRRIIKSVDKLLNAQMNIANGAQFLYVIKTEVDNKGKKIKLKPELVKSQNIIEDYLAGKLDDEENEYYYLTTEKPDNKAIDSLLDRTFGKATNNIDLMSDGSKIDSIIDVIIALQNGHKNDKTIRESV